MANTYIQIGSTVTVGAGGASSIDFTSIPSTYTDLLIKHSLRAAIGNPLNDCYLRFNSSTTGYSERMIYNSSGTTAGSASNSAGNIAWAGTMPAGSATASTFGNTEIYIPSYASSTTFKSISFDTSGENNSSTNWSLMLNAGLWSNNSAITSITLYPANSTTFVQYSTATLYGISKS